MGAQRTEPGDLPHFAHRRWIGYLGFLMPFILVGLTDVRDNIPWHDPLRSISAYYHSGAVAVFTGILFALSGFLITYGKVSKSNADDVLGISGGIFALGVALFPNRAEAPFLPPSWWREWMSTAHHISATALFAVLGLFAVWLFRRSDEPEGQPPDEWKRRRNVLYVSLGILVFVGMAWAAFEGLVEGDPIFWPEVLSLEAFAVAWLLKGRTYKHGLAAATVRYGVDQVKRVRPHRE